MSREVRVPALPESVADATVAAWHKQPGDQVREGENLVDLETDKVVLEVPSPVDGVLGAIQAREGDLVQADAVLGLIESGARKAPGTPRPSVTSPSSRAPLESVAPMNSPPQRPRPGQVIAPAARRLVKEMNLDPQQIPGSGKDGRIQKTDVVQWLDEREQAAPEHDPDALNLSEAPAPSLTGEAGRPEQRVPMTRLRARIAERLVQAQQNAALLTTFNEVNLKTVLELREKYKGLFETRYGTRLGFMSFFVKAAVDALQRFPAINASVDGDDIVYHGYFDIGIAVSSPRGLVVPTLRNCDQLSMSDIEQGIADFGQKAKDGSLSYEELTGGTFSITNGGVFGSLLSTPILNPPQSAILGMHKIQERPIVENGQIVIAPMMYLALTYDHRIIDGREAVQFLVAIKEILEDPARLLLRV
ncbi:2-oxoglutarate dehydrogenase complex dihydrolipoyllysine-residue succinyltransferase [Thiocystis violascens]|uniref:Dihydrolipoyllysine-residue succinyltransferase component of 2-oxoglutarate dehydrogenase complex n=1 Tax=Thiocystis violascens (strain ATCC 17096 / DSM 198 / 6111) TaxID=765911 RepID=I3YFC8_THIV6|nr:2-oxoglutarate dehydrogenase complex dihydrolipoyllysine-residue succinyltransferase [Thiocystis violascens]AFL75696.1 2-oxoglutarate dehydrogenase complex dihydrolipoamide succinyltransferase [Thiocystis violascens DSM 198]